jgi:hypothetical protein
MRHEMLRPLLAALLVMTVQATLTVGTTALAGIPGSKSQINPDAHRVALGGYDPVAYFESGKPTRGIATISQQLPTGTRHLQQGSIRHDQQGRK